MRPVGLLSLLSPLALFACSTDVSVCEPGRTTACACTDGSQGAQVCEDEGLGWEACVCDPPATDTAQTATQDTADTGEDTAISDTGDTGDNSNQEPASVDVYLLGGQSNMSGLGEVAALPPSLQVAQDDVWLFSSWQPRWNGLVPTSEYGNAYFGPEVTFGRALGDVTDRPVALIKHSVGGTDLAIYWHPGVTEDDPDMGAGYSTWLTTVRAGLAALEASGEVPRLAGMIWMQGESDALDLSMAAVYEDNLRNLIARVRQDTGEPALPFALGLIDCIPCGSGRNLVRAAQQLVADEDPTVFALETEDLSMWTDAVHYNGPGMRTLGDRFAEALLGQELSEPVRPALALTGSSSHNYAGDFVVGWRFQSSEPIRVTDLGWYDLDNNGLGHTHQLGIFDAGTDSLHLTATITASEAGLTPLVDGFRYVGIEPVELPAGDWLIGGTTYDVTDPDWYLHDAEIATDGAAAYTQACYSVGSTLRAPSDWCVTTGLGAAHFVGPNLLYGPI